MMRMQSQVRSGATLTEVLMALLIMSVGVVSVFSLFPIAILSSIKANQVTTGRLLADNVIEEIYGNPEVLIPPMGSGDTFRNEWQPNTNYDVGDVIRPTRLKGGQFPVLYRVVTSTVPSGGAQSGGVEPFWTLSRVSDGGSGLEWLPAPFFGQHYVIDPIGANRNGSTFGFSGVNLDTNGLPRQDAGINNETAALRTFSHPDSWSVVYEGIPESVIGSTVMFSSDVKLPSTFASDGRVVLMSPNGKESTVRGLGGAISDGAYTIDLTAAADGFNGLVRVETFSPRYTYFLTVRRTNLENPDIRIVVVFNRSHSYEDEQLYNANFGSTTFTGVAEVADSSLQFDQVKVSWASKDAPLIKEGNYLFDSRECVWYQITEVELDTANDSAIVTLDRPVEEPTPGTGNASDVGRAMFMPGIVHVYEL